MSRLKPAKNKMSYLKMGLYGPAGSGKSRTATEVAVGLHKLIKSDKPIAIFDTEPAFSFLLPFFDEAGIEVLIDDESRALLDLMAFMDEAEKISDIAIVDSITHVWRDAQESHLQHINAGRKKRNAYPIQSLEFHHWRPIKARWSEFTDRFLSSKLHVIVCGRAGNIYEYQDKQDGSGKKELITTGTRMATEKELGYEPSLLVEMIADRKDGKIINTALVQKDRSGKINGEIFTYPSFDTFKLHIDALNLGGEHFGSMDQRDSTKLFECFDESGWDNESRMRTIHCEEITELLKKHYPSQTVQDKQSRMDLIEKFFGTRSWTAVESMKSVDLKLALSNLQVHFDNIANDVENTLTDAPF